MQHTDVSASLQDLQVFVTSSDNYKPIFDVFRQSYADSGLCPQNLQVYEYKMLQGTIGFQTETWYHALTEKMRFFARCLPLLSDRTVGLFVDADVQFFPNPIAFASVVDGMRELDLDVVFMREHTKNEVNGGVFFARNTPAANDLVKFGLEQNLLRAHSLGEQDAFNHYLRSNHDIRWQFLDSKNIVWGPHLPNDWSEVMLHHAVCTKTFERKLEQLQRIRKEYLRWRKYRSGIM